MLGDRERFDLVAHFPSAEKAKMAGQIFGGRIAEDETVSFGLQSWVGLGVGTIAGLIIGFLVSKSHLTVVFPQALTASRGILLGILWAAILGATGWVVGSAAHLFSARPTVDPFELHITIQAAKLNEMKRLLTAEGATAISINEH